MNKPAARSDHTAQPGTGSTLHCFSRKPLALICKGAMSGRGVYAARDFKEGEVVIKYELTPLTFDELKALPPEEYAATHNVNGQLYLYSEPARYVNHSENPSVRNDHQQRADVALRDIMEGEPITVDARYDDVPVLKRVDAIVVRVPSIERGLDFYREQLGMHTIWREEDTAAVRLGDSKLVLSTSLNSETDILVESVEHAVTVIERAGGRLVVSPKDTSTGNVAVVEDPFGNRFTLVDFHKDPRKTGAQGHPSPRRRQLCLAKKGIAELRQIGA